MDSVIVTVLPKYRHRLQLHFKALEFSHRFSISYAFFQMYLNNLTTNLVYDLKIQAGTRSQVGERLMHFGPFSQMQRVLLQPGCEAMRTFAPRSTEQNTGDSVILINLEEHLGTIAGAVCGTLGLLLAIFAFLLWRYY